MSERKVITVAGRPTEMDKWGRLYVQYPANTMSGHDRWGTQATLERLRDAETSGANTAVRRDGYWVKPDPRTVWASGRDVAQKNCVLEIVRVPWDYRASGGEHGFSLRLHSIRIDMVPDHVGVR